MREAWEMPPPGTGCEVHVLFLQCVGRRCVDASMMTAIRCAQAMAGMGQWDQVQRRCCLREWAVVVMGWPVRQGSSMKLVVL